MTIEERARAYATIPAQIRGFGEDIPEEFDGEMYADYIRIATEQDHIARAEERERCIELWCKSCAAYGSGVCSPNGCSHKRRFMEYLRKAIEEGGE